DETAALLDWGFAAAGKVQPVGRLVDELPPAGATGPGTTGPGAWPGTAAPSSCVIWSATAAGSTPPPGGRPNETPRLSCGPLPGASPAPGVG
ncbi:hypothetical protein AB0E96_28320, partial [Kitasatospora sp. NPDC036755]